MVCNSGIAEPLLSNFEGCSRRRLEGWAFHPEHPENKVRLEIVCDGKVIGHVVADRFRRDLQKAGYLGDGHCAFSCEWPVMPDPLTDHLLDVRRASDGTPLRRSPRVLEATRPFDDTARNWLSKLIDDTIDRAKTEADIHSLIQYLVPHLEALLEAQSRIDCRSTIPLTAFRDRWRGLIPSAGAAACIPSTVPVALFIDEQFPVPSNSAGAAAILSHMQSFQRLGFEVIFVEFSCIGQKYELAISYLSNQGIRVCIAPWYSSVEDVLGRYAGRIDVCYVHRVAAAVRYTKLIRFHNPNSLLVYNIADLHHVRLSREATVKRRPDGIGNSRQIEFDELTAVAWADRVVTHSEYEAQLLRSKAPEAKISILPWAVQPRSSGNPFEGRTGLAFIGNFAHAPNIDAVHHIASTILPRVRRLCPEIEPS